MVRVESGGGSGVFLGRVWGFVWVCVWGTGTRLGGPAQVFFGGKDCLGRNGLA